MAGIDQVWPRIRALAGQRIPAKGRQAVYISCRRKLRRVDNDESQRVTYRVSEGARAGAPRRPRGSQRPLRAVLHPGILMDKRISRGEWTVDG